jgi:hypothetical protein
MWFFSRRRSFLKPSTALTEIGNEELQYVSGGGAGNEFINENGVSVKFTGSGATIPNPNATENFHQHMVS